MDNSKQRPGGKWRLVKWIGAGTFIAYLIWGALPDFRFSYEKLNGLTPGQVIGRVGPPDYDERKDTWNPWTSEKEKSGKCGPLRFYYEDRHSWRGIEYGIEFEDNHVVLVQR